MYLYIYITKVFTKSIHKSILIKKQNKIIVYNISINKWQEDYLILYLSEMQM